MTLKQKVGQLVMFSVGGLKLSPTERRVIRKHHLGGVILFAQNYRDEQQLRALTTQIQKAVEDDDLSIGALIAADQEGGIVKRFPDMPPWKSAPNMGESPKSTAYRQGGATGWALHSAGVNVDFAPVADLDLPPEHVMRSRSFGSRHASVGQRVLAFSRGLQSRNVAATAKHFPGIGGADINSDDGRAYVMRTKWQLHNIDAAPFLEAIDGGVRMVMMSHAIYPKDGGRRPASLNRYIANKRLRNELGFTGVSISDALGEVAWKFGGDTPRACVATIRAGVDIALLADDAHVARRCAAAIRAAVKAGDIPEARIDTAVARVLELKAWLGLAPSV